MAVKIHLTNFPVFDRLASLLWVVSESTHQYSNFCQSRVGPVQWLKPYTDEVIVELGQQGVKSLLVVPVRYNILSIKTRSSGKWQESDI